MINIFLNNIIIIMTQICLTCKSVKNIKNSTYKTKKAQLEKNAGLKTIFPN